MLFLILPAASVAADDASDRKAIQTELFHAVFAGVGFTIAYRLMEIKND
jgi:hypothetical protein